MTGGPGDLRLFLVLLAGLTLFRLGILVAAPFPITPDEAQYWLFAQEPDWGYYSKPPLLAWIIAASTAVFGDGPLGIRFAIPLLHGATALAVFGAAARLFGARIGLWAGLIYATLPGVSYSSGLASTDPPMMAGWALAFYALVRLRERPHAGWVGLIAVGLSAALLGKYTAIAFVVSALLYDLTSNRGRLLLAPRALIPVLALSGLLLLPHLLWNAENGFVTLRHLAENANLGGDLFHPGKLLEFTASQFAVFGPIMFASLAVLMVQWRGLARGNDALHLSLCFAAPLLAVILVQALLSRAHANWAAPAYITATIAVAAWALASGREWIVKGSLALHLAAAIALVAGTLAFDAGWLPGTLDPAKKFRFASQLGAQINSELGPGETLLGDERKIMALALYHARLPLARAAFWNPDGRPNNHFELKASLTAATTGPYLYIERPGGLAGLKDRFDRVISLGKIEVGPGRTAGLYRLSGFQGYDEGEP